MIFYDDFVKKLNEPYTKTLKPIEYFTLEIRRKTSLYGTAIPLTLIALYQFYLGLANGTKIVNIVFGLVFLYLAFKNFRTIYVYRLKLDTVNEIIYMEKQEIKFSDIKSCTLKEGSAGKVKKLLPQLDIITNDNKQYIILLMMNRKFDLVMFFKMRLGTKFKAIK